MCKLAVTFLTSRLPHTRQAEPCAWWLYVGLKRSEDPRRRMVSKKPREFLDWETACLTDRASEWALLVGLRQTIVTPAERDVLEFCSLTDVKFRLSQGEYLDVYIQRIAPTPSRRRPCPLRKSRSPTASLRSTLITAHPLSVVQDNSNDYSHLQGMLTTTSTLMFIKLDLSISTENSWSGHPKTNSPISLSIKRKARKLTKRVMKPRDSERALNDDGSFGNASNCASGAGTTSSSLSMMLLSSSKDAIMAEKSKRLVAGRRVRTCLHFVWSKRRQDAAETNSLLLKSQRSSVTIPLSARRLGGNSW